MAIIVDGPCFIETLKVQYFSETDSPYIEFKTRPVAETHEVIDGFNVDLNDNGEVVRSDIVHISKYLDIATPGMEALLVRICKVD